MIYFPFDANLGSEKDIKHDKTEVGVKEGTSVFPVLLMWICFVKLSLTNVYSSILVFKNYKYISCQQTSSK